MSELTPVALDIETTGFASDDCLTVLGLALPLGARVFVNTGGNTLEADMLEAHMEQEFTVTVTVSVHTCEEELIDTLSGFGKKHLTPRDYLITGYNAETYRGGFDLPFLRTVCLTHGLDWPFIDLPYADLYPIVESRFNTTTQSDTISDLDNVYGLLVDDGLNNTDPFDDSAEAVTAYEESNFEKLVQHNVADILRTRALAQTIERYCSKSEFRLKSLTPASNE